MCRDRPPNLGGVGLSGPAPCLLSPAAGDLRGRLRLFGGAFGEVVWVFTSRAART